MVHMRPYTPFEARNVKFLVDRQIEFATIQVTATGLKKSILDATAPVRAYLKSRGVHDYEKQLQGLEHKRCISTWIMTATASYFTQTSLYRPVTKKGDPRLWVNKVKGVDFLAADDIFALLEYKTDLYAINLTQTDIEKVCKGKVDLPLKELIHHITEVNTSISDELLEAIRSLMSDWVGTDVVADTGIGRKVEELLGIPMNSSKAPDYKGIEIKTHREVAKVRNALFTQAPNWNLSHLKSGKAIVEKYGYVPVGGTHKSLHATLSSLAPNPQGLALQVAVEKGLLEADECRIQPDGAGLVKMADVAVWQLAQLHERLLTKHHETFWLDMETMRTGGQEYFRVKEILHTKNPVVTQFDVLLDQGGITVDFLLCRSKGGDTYSFKIKPKSRPLLFPDNSLYHLRQD